MKSLNYILKFVFRIKYNSDTNRKLRMFITNFYDQYNEHEFHYNSYRITKCHFFNYPSSIVIEIHSLSPGMIIGVKGKCIDDLKSYMQKRLSKPVQIKLEETNPFK